MISRRELLESTGELMPYSQLESEVEHCIKLAAKEGKHEITYVFPENADEFLKNCLYKKLASLGYVTHGVGELAYVRIVISW